MPLTTAQYTALKAAIVADPALNNQPQNSDGAFNIAAAMNALAVPDFWVWRTSLTERECVEQASPDLTTFSWPQYIARTEPERDGWKRLFASGTVNPSLPNVRQAIADIFSGTQAAPVAQRAHLLAVARRRATRAEKLFATGTGTTGAPATLGFEGALSYVDVETARSLA